MEKPSLLKEFDRDEIERQALSGMSCFSFCIELNSFIHKFPVMSVISFLFTIGYFVKCLEDSIVYKLLLCVLKNQSPCKKTYVAK